MNKTNNTEDVKKIKLQRSVEIKSMDGFTPQEVLDYVLYLYVEHKNKENALFYFSECDCYYGSTPEVTYTDIETDEEFENRVNKIKAKEIAKQKAEDKKLKEKLYKKELEELKAKFNK